MSSETPHEEWQVETGDEVFSTNMDEMAAWIGDGSMLRIDRVRRGNLRWIEAGKVPTLAALFDAREKAAGNSVVITTTAATAPLPPNPDTRGDTHASRGLVCSVHHDVSAAFECETCLNKFCKTCPNSYGGNVKICPFCGAMCRGVTQAEEVKPTRTYAARPPFGLADLVTALAYPFRFPAALILGGLMFTLLCVGRSGSSFGGMFMMWGSIACYLLSNTLTFGILANTVENFSQGKLEDNFMPTFDNFSIWDDGVHPFFLMLGVNLVSFLPLAAVVVFGFYSVLSVAGGSVSSSEISSGGLRHPATTAGSAEQAAILAEAARLQTQQQTVRADAISNETLSASTPVGPVEEEDFEELIAEVEASRATSPASVPEDDIAPSAALSQLSRIGLFFGIGLIISAAWAIFFFPAACAVAGYTRSLGAVLNITVGLDTVRRLGGTYAKVVVMFSAIAVLTGLATAALNTIFAPLDLPMLGNIPAIAIGSFITFYFSIVFSVVLGLALYKKADKLELPQA